MNEYGVGDDGEFLKKPIDEIRDDLKTNFKQELGSDIELRPSSPMTQILDAVAIEVATQWDAAEAAYYSSFFQDATGEQLDKQLALAGFSRRRLRGATGEVTFSRDSPAARDINIEAETVVTTLRTETRPPIPFETTETATIFSGEMTAENVSIRTLSPWQTEVDVQWLGEESNVEPNTITRLQQPVSGVDEVTNPLSTGDRDSGFTEGRDEEVDAEFKLRYENSLAEGGVSTAPAIQSSVFQFDDGIESVRVEEIRDPELGYGPEVTVLAPDVSNDVIAQAIFESRAGGVESFGEQEGTAQYDDGRETPEHFNFAEEQTVYIDIDLTVTDTFPSGGDIDIENNLIRFIGGLAHDEIQYPGLEIGVDVVYDQVKQRVMEVRGVTSATVEIGTDPDELNTSNIEIADLEVAMSGIDEITVTGHE